MRSRGKGGCDSALGLEGLSEVNKTLECDVRVWRKGDGRGRIRDTKEGG